jgi:putative hydrolase of the HAD superfamily
MGMRTVWIRTDESVKRATDTNLDHIHHQTDDLATWLADWVSERNARK